MKKAKLTSSFALPGYSCGDVIPLYTFEEVLVHPDATEKDLFLAHMWATMNPRLISTTAGLAKLDKLDSELNRHFITMYKDECAVVAE